MTPVEQNQSMRIREVIAASATPMSFAEIIEASGASAYGLGSTLARMVKRNHLIRSGLPGRNGSSAGYRYSIGPDQPAIVYMRGRSAEEIRAIAAERFRRRRAREALAAGKPTRVQRMAAKAARAAQKKAKADQREADRMARVSALKQKAEARQARVLERAQSKAKPTPCVTPQAKAHALKNVVITPSLFQPVKVQRPAETVEQFRARGGKIESLPGIQQSTAYLPRRPVTQFRGAQAL